MAGAMAPVPYNVNLAVSEGFTRFLKLMSLPTSKPMQQTNMNGLHSVAIATIELFIH